MKMAGLNVELQALAAPVPIGHATVSADDWRAAASAASIEADASGETVLVEKFLRS